MINFDGLPTLFFTLIGFSFGALISLLATLFIDLGAWIFMPPGIFGFIGFCFGRASE